MKKAEIDVGRYYICSINGRKTIAQVKSVEQYRHDRNRTVYTLRNAVTGRETKARSAAKFMRLASRTDADLYSRGYLSPAQILNLSEEIHQAQPNAVAMTNNPPLTPPTTVDQMPPGADPVYVSRLRGFRDQVTSLPLESKWRERQLAKIERELTNTRVWRIGEVGQYLDLDHRYHGRIGRVESVIRMGGGPFDWAILRPLDLADKEVFAAPFWALHDVTTCNHLETGDLQKINS